MLPILYKSTATIPAPNTMQELGRVTKCISCVSDETLNDDTTLSASFAPTDELIDEIQNQRFLLVQANPFDPPQYFELFDSTYDEVGRLAIKGRHIKHCGYNNIVGGDFAFQEGVDTPLGHWDFIAPTLRMQNSFTFSTNITANISMEIGYTKFDTLGKFLEEMASKSGGELHFNNFNYELLAARGSKKNYTLRWNSNISSPSLNLSTADIYTHVCAFANLTAKYNDGAVDREYPIQPLSTNVYALSGSTSKLMKIYMFDATSHFEQTFVNPQLDYTSIISQLNAIASQFATGAASNALKKSESANLKVTYRPRLDEMQEIGLGDTVDVMLKGGRTVEAKITKTSFDCLAERWNGIELGKERIKLADYIAKRR